MTQLFQSPFLQSLGYAIANSLWQMAILWLVYMTVSGLGRFGAASKYRLAVAMQVTGFVWFVVTFQFYFTQYNQALQSAQPVAQSVQAIVAAKEGALSRTINWMVRGELLLPYVSMAYLLLIVLLCIRWVMGYRDTQRMRGEGLQKMPVDWRLFVERISQQMGIAKKVSIYLSDHVRSPLTIGFLKPLILIPVASINHLTTQQLEAVLLHELAHIKRYDYLVNLLLSVVEISLFFNPFTQLLSKNIRKERENSCDDWVLQYEYDASVYAEALLRIAYLQQAPALAMAATGKKSELLVRVKRMIGEKENRFNYRRQLFAFLVVTGMLSSIAWINPRMQRRQEKTPLSQSGKKQALPYTVEPMAVQVENPLFNPVFFLSKPLKEEMQKNIASAQKEIDDAMMQMPDLKGLPFQAIESVNPIVANAMEQASRALALSGSEADKQMVKNEVLKAKAEMNKMYFDTVLFSPIMNPQFKVDLANSMKAAEDGLRKARIEIARSFRTNTAAQKANANIDPDLSAVLNDLGELGKPILQNIILNSLDLSSAVIGNLAKQSKEKAKNATDKTKELQLKKSKVTVEEDGDDDDEEIRRDIKNNDKPLDISGANEQPTTQLNAGFFISLASWTSVQQELAEKQQQMLNSRALLHLKLALMKLAQDADAKKAKMPAADIGL